MHTKVVYNYKIGDSFMNLHTRLCLNNRNSWMQYLTWKSLKRKIIFYENKFQLKFSIIAVTSRIVISWKFWFQIFKLSVHDEIQVIALYIAIIIFEKSVNRKSRTIPRICVVEAFSNVTLSIFIVRLARLLHTTV